MSTVRERILDAARHHFREVGTRNARVQQICEVADVSRTSFYREFCNLDDVAAALAVQRWKQSIATVIQEVAALAPLQAWREFIAILTLRTSLRSGWGSEDDQLIHIIGLLYRNGGRYLQDMVEVVRPFIEQGQQCGLVRTDVSIERLADGLFRQIWTMTSVPFVEPDPETQGRQYIDDFVLPSILKPAAASGTEEQLLALMQQVVSRLDRLESRLPPCPTDDPS